MIQIGDTPYVIEKPPVIENRRLAVSGADTQQSCRHAVAKPA